VIFDHPQLATMLGEMNGEVTPRLEKLVGLFKDADLKPVISHDILGWLMVHYVEFLGIIGGMLNAGCVNAFVQDKALIRRAILASREGLNICQARGVKKSSIPINNQLVLLPVSLLTPLIRMQYQTLSIRQFFEENIKFGRDELSTQYFDVLAEGKRLGIDVPFLSAFEPDFATYHKGS